MTISYSKFKYTYNASTIIALIVFVLFCVYFVPLSKPFPYSDDWSYVGYSYNNFLDFITWAFGSHNDHRIPIQKILHFILLKISGGDFRSLLILNGFVCLLTAFCWIAISRIVNSRVIFTEVTIPLLTISFGFNSMFWGFNFQFLSSFLFLSIALLFLLKSYNQICNYNFFFFFLSLCALCGANGLFSSLIFGIGSIALSFHFNLYGRIKRNELNGLMLWVLTVLILVFYWKPSAATSTEISAPSVYLHFFVEILKSWMGVYGAGDSTIKLFASSCVFFGAIYVPLRNYLRLPSVDEFRKIRFFLIVLFLFVCQNILLVFIVTAARASSQPWWPGLELHYGYLVIGLPLSLAVSSGFVRHSMLRILVYLIFILLVSVAFVHNLLWRSNVAENEFKVNSTAIADLLSSKDSLSVAKEHIKSFYWVDGEQAEIAVGRGIDSLRNFRLWSTLK